MTTAYTKVLKFIEPLTAVDPEVGTEGLSGAGSRATVPGQPLLKT